MTRRTERLNELLREEISQIFFKQIKNVTGEHIVTVTEVATSPDLRTAKVYISVMGDPGEKQELFKKFSSAAGYIRKELGSRLYIRRIPELLFIPDNSIEQGTHLLHLIDQLAAERKAVEEDLPAD
ncbi:MAG: 30S ribosome-binding factor RbfA [Dehalococcoidia bacterium]|nr:30S ribosome-binding factor RbfA [Dehalococcoidia bacterium]